MTGPAADPPGAPRTDLPDHGALVGLRVLVPRIGDDPIAEALRSAGADVAAVRVTRSEPLDADPTLLDPAGADWVLVTSARTVARLADVRLGVVGAVDAVDAVDTVDGLIGVDSFGGSDHGPGADDGPGPRTWPTAVATARATGTRVGSVGPATTAALARVGVPVDLESPDGTAAALVGAIGPAPTPSGSGPDAVVAPDAPDAADAPDASPAQPRVLLPASALADPSTADRLRAAGWAVDAVPVYTTVPADPAATTAAATPWPDAVVVTSPSTLRALVDAAGTPPATTRLVAIGPTTAAAIDAAGLVNAATAPSPTPDGIVDAVTSALAIRATPNLTAPPRRTR
ncbi:uroporphyrinogen-III synthase [Georgenia sp. Z1344]|uniref:uroporphyrinogen-III synthase n=1 Tax=Georgenia sp. Z1344 TaxID=3416706 RepID=UPI003CF04267